MKLRSAETPGFPLCNETFSGAEIRRACLPPSPHLESLLIALDLSPFGSGHSSERAERCTERNPLHSRLVAHISSRWTSCSQRGTVQTAEQREGGGGQICSVSRISQHLAGQYVGLDASKEFRWY